MPDSGGLSIQSEDQVTVVRIQDPSILNTEHIQESSVELGNLVGHSGSGTIILDFSQVDFLSSAALGLLVSLNKKAKTAGAQLVLSGLSSEIMKVFKITSLDKLFVFKNEKHNALSAAGGGTASEPLH